MWEKQKKKKGKGGKGKKKFGKQQPVYIVNKVKPAITNVGATTPENDEKTDSPTANGVSLYFEISDRKKKLNASAINKTIRKTTGPLSLCSINEDRQLACYFILRFNVLTPVKFVSLYTMNVFKLNTKNPNLFQSIPKGTKISRHRNEGQSTDEDEGSENEVDNDSDNDAQGDQNEKGTGEVDDEEDWIKFQEEAKKDNSLETKSKETFPVHCPYYPGVSDMLSVISDPLRFLHFCQVYRLRI